MKSTSTSFKGLSLNPADAFRNIAVMIEAGLLLTIIDSEDHSDGGDYVLSIAKKYAEAAHDAALENCK